MPQCRQTSQTAWQWSDDDRGLLDGLFNDLKNDSEKHIIWPDAYTIYRATKKS